MPISLFVLMSKSDTPVVISAGQNEEEKFQQKGLTILPHRERLTKENPPLDEKFKDPNHPLRIVFVCAMWMTGFDVPSCSTIYLDKPLKNHTLMQTIARANRVFRDKVNGLIVDYVGIFRNLEEALKIYGSGSGGGVREGDSPIQPKAQLVELLRQKLQDFNAYLTHQERLPNTLLEKLQQTIAAKLQNMVKLNKSRLNYYDKFQQMIADYNSKTRNAEAFLNQLLQLVEDLNQEDQRAIAENLDEEKLALFDLLIDPTLALTEAEKTTIKKGAEDLLSVLKREKLVLDWRNRQVTRSAVKVTIEDVLDQCLPVDKYSEDRWTQKCEQVYQHIYESYTDREHQIYRQVA